MDPLIVFYIVVIIAGLVVLWLVYPSLDKKHRN